MWPATPCQTVQGPSAAWRSTACLRQVWEPNSYPPFRIAQLSALMYLRAGLKFALESESHSSGPIVHLVPSSSICRISHGREGSERMFVSAMGLFTQGLSPSRCLAGLLSFGSPPNRSAQVSCCEPSVDQANQPQWFSKSPPCAEASVGALIEMLCSSTCASFKDSAVSLDTVQMKVPSPHRLFTLLCAA